MPERSWDSEQPTFIQCISAYTAGLTLKYTLCYSNFTHTHTRLHSYCLKAEHAYKNTQLQPVGQCCWVETSSKEQKKVNMQAPLSLQKAPRFEENNTLRVMWHRTQQNKNTTSRKKKSLSDCHICRFQDKNMQPRDLKMTTRRKILINETKSGLRPRLYSCCTHSLVMNTLNPTDSQTLCRTKETRSNWSEDLYRNTLVHESFDGGFFWFLRLKIPRRMFNHFHCAVLQTTFFL